MRSRSLRDCMSRRPKTGCSECTARARKGVRVRETLKSDRDEWVSFHAGPPAPHPSTPHDLPGYNVVTHDLSAPNGGASRVVRASNPGPWAVVSTLLQLFGYYHGYFGVRSPTVNHQLIYARVSSYWLRCAASSPANDERGREFFSFVTINVTHHPGLL